VLEGRTAIHRHVNMLEIGADKKVRKMLNIKFRIGKCKVLHLGVSSPMYLYRLGAAGQKAVLEKRT